VSWEAARRAERAFLEAWDRTRPKRRPRHLGVDEIQRGKGQHFWTVLSDLARIQPVLEQRTETVLAPVLLQSDHFTARGSRSGLY
jgi:hypothetical protein